jgi:hypothetical protein
LFRIGLKPISPLDRESRSGRPVEGGGPITFYSLACAKRVSRELFRFYEKAVLLAFFRMARPLGSTKRTKELTARIAEWISYGLSNKEVCAWRISIDKLGTPIE